MIYVQCMTTDVTKTVLEPEPVPVMIQIVFIMIFFMVFILIRTIIAIHNLKNKTNKISL